MKCENAVDTAIESRTCSRNAIAQIEWTRLEAGQPVQVRLAVCRQHLAYWKSTGIELKVEAA